MDEKYENCDLERVLALDKQDLTLPKKLGFSQPYNCSWMHLEQNVKHHFPGGQTITKFERRSKIVTQPNQSLDGLGHLVLLQFLSARLEGIRLTDADLYSSLR